MRALVNIVVSEIARVEVAAAIWRKTRLGELGVGDGAALAEGFEWDWYTESYAIVPVSENVLETAALSVARHPLRAYDAVQLATALVARSADSELTTFACFDEQLASAARLEGFHSMA